MHELGIMYGVVRQVLGVAEENGLTEIEALVLQVGALSAVVPRYLEACFPAAADGTLLQGARLEIQLMPANGRCRPCGKVFDVMAHQNRCPLCGQQDFELLSGTGLFIKELRGR